MRRSIVYVWDADYPWDVRTEKTCQSLTAAGYDVTIVARNEQWLPETSVLPEGSVRRMPPWRWAGRKLDVALGFPAFINPRWYSLITRAVADTKADLILVRDIPLCPTAIAVGRRHGIPVLLDMAENYPAMMRTLWETGRYTPIDYVIRNPRATDLVERWSVKHVDHIIVVVEESAERLRGLGVPTDKLTIVSNTPPLRRVEEMPPRIPRSDNRIDVAYMGNLEVVRGLLESVDAVAQLNAAGHRVRLRIIGKGRDEALIRAHAEASGCDSTRVEFLGYIASHREALEIVAAADIGLMPHRKSVTWDTTIPNKLFDYMAAGLPVVSSNAAPCERILRETGCGEVFESGNPASIGAAILRATEPSRAQSLSDAGRRAIRDRYNWEYDTAVMLRAVEQLWL